MKRTASILVSRPADDLFAFLSQVANETQWRQSITASGYRTAGPVNVGSAGFTEVSMGGRKVTMEWTVTDFDPGQRVAWVLTGGPWQGGGSYTVRPEGSNTLITASLEVRLAGAARALEPILGLQLGKGLRADLARLEQVVTTGDRC
jgi:Polyketide cyclase / dehydrase and lipid transport